MKLAFADYEKGDAITFSAFWALVRGHAEAKQLKQQLLCSRTGKKWLLANSTPKTQEIREGATVAKACAPPMPVEDGWQPHGRWAWDRALIDHTKADVQLLLDGVEGTRRAWLSVMIDGYSRKVLAFILDFNPPKKMTLMHLMRECVRRHRRLPSTLVLDNGPDFKSTYFQTLMSHLYITPEYRPPRRPRFGAQIERWFGTANTKLFHQLLGNTKAMLKVRQVTKKINPSNLAVWSLELLHEGLSEYCYEIYNQSKHSGLGCAPEARFNTGLDSMGEKHGVPVEDYQQFLMLTMLTPPKGKE